MKRVLSTTVLTAAVLIPTQAALAAQPAAPTAPASTTVAAATTGAPARVVPSTPKTRATLACVANLTSFPVVKPGAKGGSVKALQCLLRVQNHRISVDGVYGPATRRAVTAFFSTKPFEPAQGGVIGSHEWTSLIASGLPYRTMKIGDRGTNVKVLQAALKAWGAKIAVDGVYGRRTGNAIAAVQKRQHMEYSGYLDNDTLEMLKHGA